MPTTGWNSSGSAPLKTTTFTTDANERVNSISLPVGNTAYRKIDGATVWPTWVTGLRMYLAGYGAARTSVLRLKDGTTNYDSASFNLTSKSTTLTEPRAEDTGVKDIDYKFSRTTSASQTKNVSVGFDPSGGSFFGRWGNDADSTTLWGQTRWITVPSAPRNLAASSTNITTTSFRPTWDAPSDDGGSTVTAYYIQVSTTSNFSNIIKAQNHTSGSDITDLTSGTTYYVRVFAENAVTSNFNNQPMSVASSTLTVTTSSVTTYTVSFDTNGGGTNPSSKTVVSGATFTFDMSNPTRTGYSFSGWQSSDSSFSTNRYYFNNTSHAIGQATTFTAQWTANSFVINYNANGGTGTTTATSWAYPTTSGLVRSNNFSRSGYTFKGWATSSGSTTVSYNPGDSYFYDTSTGSGSTILYAVWELSSVTPNWTTGDTTITNTAILNNPYENTATDRTVSATVSTGTVSYTLQLPSSGTFPSWLNIGSSTGQLSGTPTQQGVFRFKVRATSSTGPTSDTSDLTITVIPAGQRITSSTDETPLQWAKRFIGVGQTTTNAQGQLISADAQGYVLLTRMQRWNGSSWENI